MINVGYNKFKRLCKKASFRAFDRSIIESIEFEREEYINHTEFTCVLSFSNSDLCITFIPEILVDILDKSKVIKASELFLICFETDLDTLFVDDFAEYINKPIVKDDFSLSSNFELNQSFLYKVLFDHLEFIRNNMQEIILGGDWPDGLGVNLDEMRGQ